MHNVGVAAETPARKPLGVRVTAEQHRLITEAAAREHRSVNSFVIHTLLRAAEAHTAQAKREEDVRAALREAREMIRAHRTPGRLLSDELIADRRAEAALE